MLHYHITFNHILLKFILQIFCFDIKKAFISLIKIAGIFNVLRIIQILVSQLK